jgi:hypothetical protein
MMAKDNDSMNPDFHRDCWLFVDNDRKFFCFCFVTSAF